MVYWCGVKSLVESRLGRIHLLRCECPLNILHFMMTFITGEIGTREIIALLCARQPIFPSPLLPKNAELSSNCHRCSTLFHQRAILLSLSWRCVHDGRFFREDGKEMFDDWTPRSRPSEREKKIHSQNNSFFLFSAVYLANITALPFHILYFCLLLVFFSWVPSEKCKAGREHDSIGW